MKKLALAIASLSIAATTVLACPHMDQATEEAAPPKTAEKKEAPKTEKNAEAKTADKKDAKPAQKDAKPAEKTEKKTDKVSSR